MPKRSPSKSRPARSRRVKRAWPPVFVGLFFALLAGMLYFLGCGVQPALASFTRGYLGLHMAQNERGLVVLTPQPGGSAGRAGVEQGDVLLAVDNAPLRLGENPSDLLAGRVGEPVSITVLKADGREETYTIVRSENARADLEEAGLTVEALAYYFVALALLRFLAFAGAGIFVLLRRPRDWLFLLAAYALLFFLPGFNYADLVSNGAALLGLEWPVLLARAAGIFLAYSLLLLFPGGAFASDWARLLFILAVFWMFPYVSAQFVPGAVSRTVQMIVWGSLFLFGLAYQAYRSLRLASAAEAWQARPAIVASLVLGVILLVSWGVSYLPENTFDTGGWTWFYMITALPVDAALIYLAVNLARSMSRIAEQAGAA